MTEANKKLLLIELCARLPYNVTCQFTWTYCNETTDGEEVVAKENDNIRNIDIHTKEIQADYYGEWVDLENCKPYLRPISSMTDEEMDKLFDILNIDKDGKDEDWIKINDVLGIKFFFPTGKWVEHVALAYDYLYSIHLDFRGLIHLGLAFPAPTGMYV